MEITLLIRIAVLALFSAFLVILSDKWGIRTAMQVKGPKIISKMANCDFCICFWTSVGLAVIAAALSGDYCWIMATPGAAVAARLLL